jgi:hypothetical protein
VAERRPTSKADGAHPDLQVREIARLYAAQLGMAGDATPAQGGSSMGVNVATHDEH